MTTDAISLSATDLVCHYRDKTLSPVEVVEETFAQIERVEPHLNAYCALTPNSAMAQAERSEARWRSGEPMGLLDGVPLAVKDLTPLKGVPFRRGSATTPDNEICDIDGPCIAHLKAHGAVIVGKTTTPEFGWKGVTDSPLTGITRNPWDKSKTTGGSSGGAAAAVAACMATLAEGTDGAGSIRMPSAFTGIFGLYPTAGRIPYFPLSTLGTMTQCGPMTRTVADGALMFTAMTGDDPRDPVGLTGNDRDWRTTLGEDLDGLTIAYSPTLGFAKPDGHVRERVDDAAATLEALGARIEPVERIFDEPRDILETLYRTAMARICEGVTDDQMDMLDPGLRALAISGRAVTAIEHSKALTGRDELAVTMNGFFKRFDALITPLLPLTAFDAGCDFPPDRGMSHWFDWNPYTYPFNLTNSPAGSMPCGVGPDGLPIAFQIVAPRYREDTIIRIASAYERGSPIAIPDLSALAHA